MTNPEKAKDILLKNEYTVVLVKEDDIVTSTERGVKPLLGFIRAKKNYEEYSAADKVVGKAAAMLYVKLGIKTVYANIMSKTAIDVFEKHSVNYSYHMCTETIFNRDKSDICPMEKTVRRIDDIEDAYEAIKFKVHELMMRNTMNA